MKNKITDIIEVQPETSLTEKREIVKDEEEEDPDCYVGVDQASGKDKTVYTTIEKGGPGKADTIIEVME
jgi:hypothetical protein